MRKGSVRYRLSTRGIASSTMYRRKRSAPPPTWRGPTATGKKSRALSLLWIPTTIISGIRAEPLTISHAAAACANSSVHSAFRITSSG
jgi:hypothetical protein